MKKKNITLDKIKSVVKDVLDNSEDTVVINIDSNNNIHFKSKNLNIVGGPGATKMFDDAMKASVKDIK